MVRIITDSAADFEPQELAALNLSCIPIAVILGDDQYEENVNLTKDQFFELLASTGATPKTSQPSPQILMDLYEEAKKAGLLTMHVGLGRNMLNDVFYAIDHTEIPVKTFFPTHMGRNIPLVSQGVKLTEMGGTVVVEENIG